MSETEFALLRAALGEQESISLRDRSYAIKNCTMATDGTLTKIVLQLEDGNSDVSIYIDIRRK